MSRIVLIISLFIYSFGGYCANRKHTFEMSNGQIFIVTESSDGTLELEYSSIYDKDNYPISELDERLEDIVIIKAPFINQGEVDLSDVGVFPIVAELAGEERVILFNTIENEFTIHKIHQAKYAKLEIPQMSKEMDVYEYIDEISHDKYEAYDYHMTYPIGETDDILTEINIHPLINIGEGLQLKVDTNGEVFYSIEEDGYINEIYELIPTLPPFLLLFKPSMSQQLKLTGSSTIILFVENNSSDRAVIIIDAENGLYNYAEDIPVEIIEKYKNHQFQNEREIINASMEILKVDTLWEEGHFIHPDDFEAYEDQIDEYEHGQEDQYSPESIPHSIRLYGAFEIFIDPHNQNLHFHDRDTNILGPSIDRIPELTSNYQAINYPGLIDEGFFDATNMLHLPILFQNLVDQSFALLFLDLQNGKYTFFDELPEEVLSTIDVELWTEAGKKEQHELFQKLIGSYSENETMKGFMYKGRFIGPEIIEYNSKAALKKYTKLVSKNGSLQDYEINEFIQDIKNDLVSEDNIIKLINQSHPILLKDINERDPNFLFDLVVKYDLSKSHLLSLLNVKTKVHHLLDSIVMFKIFALEVKPLQTGDFTETYIQNAISVYSQKIYEDESMVEFGKNLLKLSSKNSGKMFHCQKAWDSL